jgi:hypothetical protein
MWRQRAGQMKYQQVLPGAGAYRSVSLSGATE